MYGDKLDKIKSNLAKSQSLVEAIEANKDMNSVFPLIRLSERNVNEVRSLAYASGSHSHEAKARDIFLEEFGGSLVLEDNDVLVVKLPLLLPSTKTAKSYYIERGLYDLFEDVFYTLNMSVYQEPVTICFEHVYSEETNWRNMRDFDNIETKSVLDVISSYVLLDDNPMFMSMYESARLGDKDETIVTIIPDTQLVDYLAKEVKKSSKKKELIDNV